MTRPFVLWAERPPWWRPIERWRWDHGKSPRLVGITIRGLHAGEMPQLVLTADIVGRR